MGALPPPWPSLEPGAAQRRGQHMGRRWHLAATTQERYWAGNFRGNSLKLRLCVPRPKQTWNHGGGVSRPPRQGRPGSPLGLGAPGCSLSQVVLVSSWCRPGVGGNPSPLGAVFAHILRIALTPLHGVCASPPRYPSSFSHSFPAGPAARPRQTSSRVWSHSLRSGEGPGESRAGGGRRPGNRMLPAPAVRQLAGVLKSYFGPVNGRVLGWGQHVEEGQSRRQSCP